MFLDEFTHNWGWFAHHVSWYDNRIMSGELLGREWTVYRVFQYVGHVGLTALCIALLWAYGRQRWMQARGGDDRPEPDKRRELHDALGLSAIGLGAATLWIASDRVDGSSRCSAQLRPVRRNARRLARSARALATRDRADPRYATRRREDRAR